MSAAVAASWCLAMSGTPGATAGSDPSAAGEGCSVATDVQYDDSKEPSDKRGTPYLCCSWERFVLVWERLCLDLLCLFICFESLFGMDVQRLAS